MPTRSNIEAPAVAVEYASEVRKRLGDHIRRIILFGSQARGDARAGSDYDFIVVVDDRRRDLREGIADVADRLLDSRDALCASIIYSDAEWRRVRQSPLGWNVLREGIVL